MIFGQRIEVQWSRTLVDDSDCVGVFKPRKNVIILQAGDGEEVARPVSQVEQTFCHELVHSIFNFLGETELDGNEKLVELIGQALHQAFSTMTYEEEYNENMSHDEKVALGYRVRRFN